MLVECGQTKADNNKKVMECDGTVLTFANEAKVTSDYYL